MSVVLLSVGGQLFTTTQATLTSPLAHGSMLETLVQLHTQRLDASPAGDSTAADAPSGHGMQPTLLDARHPDALFIDRDGGNFGYILSYLRDGAEMVLPADLHTTNLVLREAQFFQLSGLIELLQAHKRRFEQEDDHVKKQTELLEGIDNSLADLRRYLTPDALYHRRRGKRGGPGPLDYKNPRKLLDDLQSTVWTALQSRSSD